MDATTLTVSGLISLGITSLVGYLLHRSIVNHVGVLARNIEDIRLVNQMTLQKYSYDAENRRKTQIVAELFSLWLQSAPSTTVLHNNLYRPFVPDDFKKLQQLCYECALWLPPDIFNDLNQRLCNAPGAKDIKQILVDVRTHLNPDIGAINWMNIVHF